jgi:hypothetical protein
LYRISILTGDRKGSSTSATVSITLFGKTNRTSGTTTLDATSGSFDRGKSSIFGVESEDLGELTKIRIGMLFSFFIIIVVV